MIILFLIYLTSLVLSCIFAKYTKDFEFAILGLIPVINTIVCIVFVVISTIVCIEFVWDNLYRSYLFKELKDWFEK